MTKKIVSTAAAPAAIGPYSQAVAAQGTALYISGQLPVDPETGLMPEKIEDQTVQSMKNLISIVKAAGGSEKSIIKCTLFIRDMEAFSRINEKYQSFFEKEPPARAVVEVSSLPKGALIEIEAVAVL
ncbi:MAG: Rid family detoxifying hydrolase [Eubacteriales bacterium]|nr:Rid family detoxifying hydrolase [Eubacteriales bacterium]